MNNVLLEPLPTEYNGYEINTWFQIGIQLTQLFEDEEIDSEERGTAIVTLLFGNFDGSIREFPTDPEEFQAVLKWFINGWYHDNPVETEKKQRVMDYDVDQWRIYADFRQIYGINLNEADLHWWEFQGLLWNMPHEQSSFMKAIEIRTKKPSKHASAEEKNAIREGKRIFALKEKKKKVLTKEEENKIDAYDEMMKEIKRQKSIEKEIISKIGV